MVNINDCGVHAVRVRCYGKDRHSYNIMYCLCGVRCLCLTDTLFLLSQKAVNPTVYTCKYIIIIVILFTLWV